MKLRKAIEASPSNLNFMRECVASNPRYLVTATETPNILHQGPRHNALHVAAKWGKSNMVTLLLERGANLESKTRDGLTPLHCAARSGHENVVDVMIQRGAPISAKTKNGLAPLHMSSQGDHVDAARILLHHKASSSSANLACELIVLKREHFSQIKLTFAIF